MCKLNLMTHEVRKSVNHVKNVISKLVILLLVHVISDKKGSIKGIWLWRVTLKRKCQTYRAIFAIINCVVECGFNVKNG